MARQDTNRVGLRLESDTVKSYPRTFNQHELKLAEAINYDGNVDDNFRQALVVSHFDNTDGTVYTGATGEVVSFHSGIATYEIRQLAVAATPAAADLVAPFQSVDGLELKPIAAADALELTLGTTSLSKAAYTVGSFKQPKMFMQASIKIDDISDVSTLVVGLRKAEAYRADWNDYDEAVAFNIGAGADGRINISKILNNAATSTVNTTNTAVADGDTIVLRIEVANDGKCVFKVNGSAPTVTTTFAFDSGEVILPFIALDTETGDPGVSISQLQVGYI